MNYVEILTINFVVKDVILVLLFTLFHINSSILLAK